VKAGTDSPNARSFGRSGWGLVLAGTILATAVSSAHASDTPSIEPDSSASGPRAVQPPPTSLLDQPLPEWGELHFLDPPNQRHPVDFRGHVMVIRFWTEGCPRCKASATTLADWTHRYGERGLVVIGIYLPKEKQSVEDSTVRQAARDLGLDALLSVDQDWSALRHLWEHGGSRFSVSVSLLVDRHGIVRAVHRGGYLTETRASSREETHGFRLAMERALAES